MNRSVAGLFGFITLVAAPEAKAWTPPPDTQPGMALVLVECSVTDQGLSSACQFINPINDEVERLKAGTELGFLDAHPFPLVAANPGAQVQVLVRLKVSPSSDGKGFDISAPESLYSTPSGPDITDPVWVVSPHGSWADGFVPERAMRMAQKGGASARCMATAAGVLVNCQVVQEAPKDFGFGQAALRLLQRVRMKPLSASRASIAGRPFSETFIYRGGDPKWYSPPRQAPPTAGTDRGGGLPAKSPN
jgi:hypothetical protein